MLPLACQSGLLGVLGTDGLIGAFTSSFPFLL